MITHGSRNSLADIVIDWRGYEEKHLIQCCPIQRQVETMLQES